MSSQLPVRRETAPPSGSVAPGLAAAGAARTTSAVRKVAALVIAVVSDAISVVAEFAPPIQWVVDGTTAVLLFAILGFRWPLLPVLVAEAIPGVAAFPAWTIVVAVMLGLEKTAPRAD
jgi:hypothetical protein